jgi:hypothetical protein
MLNGNILKVKEDQKEEIEITVSEKDAKMFKEKNVLIQSIELPPCCCCC